MKREKLRQDSGKQMASASDTIDEASFKLRAVACPTWADTRASSLARAARALGLTASQARRIIYRECKRIDAHVLDNIRAAYSALEAKAERIADEQHKISITLRREIEGRNHAAPFDHQGDDLGMARRPAGREGKTPLVKS